MKLEFWDEVADVETGQLVWTASGVCIAHMYSMTEIIYRVVDGWPTRDAAAPEEDG